VSAAAVGVVAFEPNGSLIIPLVRAAIEEAGCAFVFVNAVADEEVLAGLRQLGARCSIIHCDDNLGVAEALNMIALHAIMAGYRRVVLFDQDSRPPKGLVGRLNEAMDRLQASGEQVAVVGPTIVAPRGRELEFKSPRYFPADERQPLSGAVPVRYVITSGSLVDLDAFRSVGQFRSDFFIDSIDTEWCFRAWSRGYSCWYVPSVSMEHTIGEGVIFGRYPRQSAMRMYSWFRNQLVTITLPHVPMLWKARLALYAAVLAVAVVVDSKFDRAVVASIGRAFVDGWKRRLGPPPGAIRARRMPLE
jgi:rhamnosyltransferase